MDSVESIQDLDDRLKSEKMKLYFSDKEGYKKRHEKNISVIEEKIKARKSLENRSNNLTFKPTKK
jgi:hypothetical protein